MELMRLGVKGQERPCVRDEEGTIYDLTALTDDIHGPFLADHGVERTRQALASGTLPQLGAAENLRIGPPIARPGAVLCIGQNYAAHAAESGDLPPKVPILFFKHPNTIVGPRDAVCIPPRATKVDWEVELAVIIGRRARYLDSPDEAPDVISGYTISNDVSERQYQLEESGGQWSKGKCCETFNPLGPALVPSEELEAQNLRLWSKVNGDVRQDSNTKDMIFSIDYLVWHLSQYLVLEPGDIINTGTPQGVALSGRFPYLQVGDCVDIGIDGLGTQRQMIRAAKL